MKIRLVSDLHLEFETFIVPEGDEDVLVLAGDIVPLKQKTLLKHFIEDCASKFPQVLWVPGNHEFYGANIDYDWGKASVPTNVHKLSRDFIYINDIKFVGATLWSNIPPSKYPLVSSVMNDYRLIRQGPGYSKLTVNRSVHEHLMDKEFVFSQAEPGCVVVTHHGPSYRSVNPRFFGDALNCAYVTELDLESLENVTWLHGHTHDSVNYIAGSTWVRANPKGYRDENKSFNPYLTVEV
jgi:Icc-related predicted phosphoesterase